MTRTRVLVLLALATATAEAQTSSVGAGASLPVGKFGPAANTGFGLALLSNTEQTLGPFDVRVDITFDRFGGKTAPPNPGALCQPQGCPAVGISRYQYTSAGLSLVKNVGAGFYWLGGFSLYQASDQQTNASGQKGTANHSNGGAKAGLGVNFTMFGRGAFLEGNWIKLLASGPGITWVPVRLGFRL